MTITSGGLWLYGSGRSGRRFPLAATGGLLTRGVGGRSSLNIGFTLYGGRLTKAGQLLGNVPLRIEMKNNSINRELLQKHEND